MIFKEILKTSIASILKNRRRSLLTMLGIIIGIAAVITIMSLGTGFQKTVVSNLTESDNGDVTVNIIFRPDDPNLYQSDIQLFSDNDVSLASYVQGVSKAERGSFSRNYKTLKVSSPYNENEEVMTAGFGKYHGDMTEGRNLDDADTGNSVIISDKVAESYLKGRKYTDSTLDINGVLFSVRGVFKSPSGFKLSGMETYDIYIPEVSYKKYFKDDEQGMNLIVTVKKGESPKEVGDRVLKVLENEGSMRNSGKYTVFDMASMTEGIGNVLKSITYFISAIAGISLIIAGVGVMNMMYISVSERTREIGIRRAMGATQSSIRNQFLLEGVIITSIGGTLGFILGIIFSRIASAFLPFKAVTDLGSVILAVVISVGTGLLFSVMPANAAARKDLIDILR